VAPPTSSVSPLPATTTTAGFTVAWSGTPGVGASSIATYDVYVSTDGGAFAPFLTGTTQNSAVFQGAFGHTYGFYSVATDNYGDRQATPAAAQASTSVAAVTVTQLTSSSPNNTSVQGTAVTFTATVSTSAQGAGVPSGHVHFVDQTTGTDLGTYALVNGQAAVTTSGFALGNNTIVATYLADPAFLTSNVSLVQVVTGTGPTNITADTSFTHTGGSLVHQAGGNRWVQSATLTNTSTSTFQGPIAVVFNNLAAGTVLYGATVNGVFVAAQQNSGGQYFIDVLAAGSLFDPHQSISISLQFNQFPGSAYAVSVYAGPGNP
jgi:hypothetical protein